MNGFFGYLLRTWLDRARGKLFGAILAVVAVETLLCAFFVVFSWLQYKYVTARFLPG